MTEQSIADLVAANTRLGLVIVHMQTEMLRGDHSKRTANLIPALRYAIDVCHQEQTPVAYIEMPGQGPTIPLIQSALKRLPTTLRRRWSEARSEDGFDNEGLTQWLRHRGATGVLVGGVYANACIPQTVDGARYEGFPAVVAGDLMSDGTESLNWDATRGLYVPSFRQALPLLKRK